MAVLRVAEAHPGWVHIHWTIPGEKKLSAVKGVRKIEGEIKRDKLKGWLMESNKSHTTMHKIIQKLGGVQYAEDEESLYFQKEIK